MTEPAKLNFNPLLPPIPSGPINQNKDLIVQPETEPSRDRFEELLARLQEQIQSEENNQSLSPIEAYVISPDDELLFETPHNKTLERNYAIWRRALNISKFIFTYSSLAYQSLAKGSMVLGAIAGSFLTQYAPIASTLGVGLYSSYQATRHLVISCVGQESLSDRVALWKSASKQEDSSSSLQRRFTALFGTSPFLKRVKNLAIASIGAYGAFVAKDIIFNRTDNFWTSAVVHFFQLAKDWMLPLPAALAAGGIAYFGMMLGYALSSDALKQLNEELVGLTEDMTFNREYSNLKYYSDREYLSNLCEMMECEDLDALEQMRASYAQEIKERMLERNYLGAREIVLDATKTLSKLNADSPERALKPALAQLKVLRKQKERALEEYQKLINENFLAKADRYLNEILKPLILKVEFIKQVILDPTRPALGVIDPTGQSYYSYVSLLAGMEIKEMITLKDPKSLEVYFAKVLKNEAAIHKSLCFEKVLAQRDPEYLQRFIQTQTLRQSA